MVPTERDKCQVLRHGNRRSTAGKNYGALRVHFGGCRTGRCTCERLVLTHESLDIIGIIVKSVVTHTSRTVPDNDFFFTELELGHEMYARFGPPQIDLTHMTHES